MAKPRVFLSSTYYDLKHVRERIERFLANFGMEPVLFEMIMLLSNSINH